MMNLSAILLEIEPSKLKLFLYMYVFVHFVFSPGESFLFCLIFKNKLTIYFWLCWVFVAVHRLSLVEASGSYYSSFCCTGFTLWWLLRLWRAIGHVSVGSCSVGS